MYRFVIGAAIIVGLAEVAHWQYMALKKAALHREEPAGAWSQMALSRLLERLGVSRPGTVGSASDRESGVRDRTEVAPAPGLADGARVPLRLGETDQARVDAPIGPHEPVSTRPHVSITSPGPGMRVQGQTLVGAELTGLETIGRVEFDVNGETQDITNVAPFRFEWDTTHTPNGPATLRVVVYNEAGRARSSSTVRVRVEN